MSDLDYSAVDVNIREDLTAAHRRAWTGLAEAGTWLTGGERVAVAREVRAVAVCDTCRQSRTALSPNAVDDPHRQVSDLPELYVEVIHRVSADPSRLTRSWFDGVMAAGMPETHYVEIVGVIGVVFSVDVFCRTLGMSLPPLPDPVDGEPSRRRPAGARQHGHWVATLAPEDLSPAESDIYDNSNAANIYRALSLVPAEVRTFRDLDDHLYLPADDIFDLETDYRAISHAQIELIAGRVSSNNRCLY